MAGADQHVDVGLFDPCLPVVMGVLVLLAERRGPLFTAVSTSLMMVSSML